MTDKMIPEGSRVLVTGATGYTGQFLVKKLVENGLKVRAIARESSNLAPFSDVEVEWIRGEIYDENTIRKGVSGIEYIFHMAGAFREAKSTKQDYRNVQVTGTQLLCKEALKQPEFKRFVHVSTMGVHGHIANPPADENSPFSPEDDYQLTKAEAETWLAEFGPQNNLPFCIIRPCTIYGLGERRLLKLFKMAARSYFPILGNGKCWLHLVHVEDLVGGMLLAAVEENALGEAFLIGSREPIKLEKMAGIIAGTYGNKIRVVRLPITPFFILADLCEVICRPFKIEPPIFRRRVAFYSKDRYFTTKKMCDVLGYQPVHENEEGIIESAKWYRDNDWL